MYAYLFAYLFFFGLRRAYLRMPEYTCGPRHVKPKSDYPVVVLRDEGWWGESETWLTVTTWHRCIQGVCIHEYVRTS